jgi:superfamily II DNA or RNA helicase
MVPRIDIIKVPFKIPGNGLTPWPERMNALSKSNAYKELIGVLIAFYVKQGHRILVTSDRVSFLADLHEQFKESSTLVTGSTSSEVRNSLNTALNTKPIIFGTQAIFSEGISINSLSCLIMGTPINNEPLLTQLIGRVVREAPGKLQPVIVDINFDGGTGASQAKARLNHYRLEAYNIRMAKL